MMVAREVFHLAFKDLRLEWRQKHSIGGIVLYLVSTIFITYLAFSGFIDATVWNALLWIIMAFAAINLTSRSFGEESPGLRLYMYTLASPVSVIFSKILVNTLIMVVLGLLGFFLFSLFLGARVENVPGFLVVLVVGVVGFASVLTMVSAIAGQVKSRFALMAILGFPLILPFLLLLIDASRAAIAGAPLATFSTGIMVMLLLVMISLTLSFLLFPYLWKD